MDNFSSDLKIKLSRAQDAENAEDFIRATFFYNDTLAAALESGNSEVIKLCKNKIVEMNKKSIASGKDFMELSFPLEIPEDKKRIYEEFISKFLSQGDLKTILVAIGRHPFFFPKVSEEQSIACKTIPTHSLFASTFTISNRGHMLRGSSDASYAWFMRMYDVRLQNRMNHYIGRVIYELMENKPNGVSLTVKELSDYFTEAGIFEEGNLKIILVGLQRYFEGDYISAMHILVPQFEAVFLRISERLGIDTVALDQKRDLATRTKILSETCLDSEEFKKVWGEDLCRLIKFVLFEQMGYKLRHKIAHGEIEPGECNFPKTTLVLYFYLVLLDKVQTKILA